MHSTPGNHRAFHRAGGTGNRASTRKGPIEFASLRNLEVARKDSHETSRWGVMTLPHTPSTSYTVTHQRINKHVRSSARYVSVTPGPHTSYRGPEYPVRYKKLIWLHLEVGMVTSLLLAYSFRSYVHGVCHTHIRPACCRRPVGPPWRRQEL